MADIEKDINNEEEELVDICTLIDDETGEEQDFELIDEVEIDGNRYYALVPFDEEAENYYIFLVTDEGDSHSLKFVGEDDPNFEKVADCFDERNNSEIDYDN